MDRMKFEGRMNYFMLTAIRSAKNEDGLISDRDLKAIELMKELIGYAEELNYEVEKLKKEVRDLKRETEKAEKTEAMPLSFIFRVEISPFYEKKTYFEGGFIMSIKERKEITKMLVKVEVVILMMIFTIILLHTMPLAGTAMFVVDCISIGLYAKAKSEEYEEEFY